MDANKCYWCGLDIGNGNFETRVKRLQYFCSLLHIKRWVEMRSVTGNEVNEIKIFVCGKYIGQLKDFELE
jgi:hypothetical protein